MTCEGQHTTWKPGKIVLSDWERIELMAKLNPMKFIKVWVDIEEDIKAELRCATIRARGKDGGQDNN